MPPSRVQLATAVQGSTHDGMPALVICRIDVVLAGLVSFDNVFAADA